MMFKCFFFVNNFMIIINLIRSFFAGNQRILPANNDEVLNATRENAVSDQLTAATPLIEADAQIIPPALAEVNEEAPITYIQNANDINVGAAVYESYSNKNVSNAFSFGTARPSYIKNSLSLYLPDIDISFIANKVNMEKGKYYLVAAKIIHKYQTGNDILVLHCDENKPLALSIKLVFPHKKSKNINNAQSVSSDQFPVLVNKGSKDELERLGLDLSGVFTLLSFSIIDPAHLD